MNNENGQPSRPPDDESVKPPYLQSHWAKEINIIDGMASTLQSTDLALLGEISPYTQFLLEYVEWMMNTGFQLSRGDIVAYRLTLHEKYFPQESHNSILPD